MKRKIFRSLDEKDIDVLMEIEKSFPNPWPLEAFFIEMEGQYNHSIGLEVDDILVGYLFYSSYPDEININHFAINPDYRRQGYASDIMDYLIEKMTKKQLLYLEVSVDNKPAIKLYEKYGLKIISRRKDYYGQGQDAYIMQRDRKESL